MTLDRNVLLFGLFLLFLVAHIGLTGCATYGDREAAGGGANYSLETPECKIVANSSREVSGVSDAIDGASCSMTSDMDSLEAIPMPLDALIILLKE